LKLIIFIEIVRYKAIIHPLRIRKTPDRRSAFLMAMVWLIATLLASPQLWTTKTVPFTYGNNTYYKCKEVASSVYSSTYSLVIFTITFLFPFITLVYVYGYIGIIMFKRQIPGMLCYSYRLNRTLLSLITSILKACTLIIITNWLIS